MAGFWDSNTIFMTQKALDFQWQKKNIVTDNIANATTPGYKAKYVTFEEELRRQMEGASYGTPTAAKYRNIMTNVRSSIHSTNNETSKMDGNNVDVANENTELARATLQYQYLLRGINGELTRLRSAVRGQ